MNFTQIVRDELAHLRVPRECCEAAELAGLARAAGSAHLIGGHMRAFEIEIEDPPVVRKAYAALARTSVGHTVEVRLFEPGRGRPRPRFVLRVEGPIDETLGVLGMTDHAGRPTPPTGKLAARRCDAAAYVRGVFMARGSISDPRAATHLEFRLPTEADAAFVERMLTRLGVTSSTRKHKGAHVVTVKGAAAAGRALAAMGAQQGYLAWEDGSVWKSVRGEANRLANFDTANARRTALSALAQRNIIEHLAGSGALFRLPAALQEAADLRLRHPDAPLEELARLSDPPVSKAAMADRFRRLGKHAEALVG